MLAPANADRGGTRCTSAFTVVSTIRGLLGFSSNRPSVAIRSDTRAAFGDTRSYGRQSQAGNRSTSASGITNASASASRAIRASSRVTCRMLPGCSRRRCASRNASQPFRRAPDLDRVAHRSIPRTPACDGASVFPPQAESARGRSASRPGQCRASPSPPLTHQCPLRLDCRGEHARIRRSSGRFQTSPDAWHETAAAGAARPTRHHPVRAKA